MAGVERRFARVLDFIFARVKKNGAFKRHRAGLSIHRHALTHVAQVIAQILDDLASQPTTGQSAPAGRPAAPPVLQSCSAAKKGFPARW